MVILLVCFTLNMVAVDPNVALSWYGNDTGLDVNVTTVYCSVLTLLRKLKTKIKTFLNIISFMCLDAYHIQAIESKTNKREESRKVFYRKGYKV